MRMPTQPVTMLMTWGQWRSASSILVYWYTKFSTVGLSFEVKIVEGGRQGGWRVGGLVCMIGWKREWRRRRKRNDLNVAMEYMVGFEMICK